MSTPKWSDDELDAFFRKSAEEADPPYDPAAWQDLKARLNKYDRTRWLNWLVPTLLLILLTGSIVWYNFRPVSTQQLSSTSATPAGTVHTQAGNVPQPGATGSKPIIIARDNRPAAVSKTESVASRPVPATHPEALKRAATSDVEPVGEHSALPIANPPTERLAKASLPAGSPVNQLNVRHKYVRLGNLPRTGTLSGRVGATTKRDAGRLPGGMTNTKYTARATPAGLTGQRPLLAGQPVGLPNGIARHNAKTGGLGRHRSHVSGFVHNPPLADNTIRADKTGPGPEVVPTASARSVANPDGPLPAEVDRLVSLVMTPAGPIKPAKWPTRPVLLPEPFTEPVQSAMPRSARHRLYGLSVQAVLSPDLSTVGLKNFDRPGSNLGLLVQYQLSERFSVQTGALWSTKLYKSTPSEYTSPVYMHVLPESITGKCTMFDIPLNIRYDVLLRPGGVMRGPRRWFVSGGATSYFIDREIYDYKFMNPNDPAITAKGWDSRAAGRKGGSFGLSNLNFSLGYEQPVSKRLSWQIEPFMKVPLQPIGYFKVKLVSTGAFFSLRYHL